MDSTVSITFQENTFKTIFSLPGNQTCADCPSFCPDWASINLGVLICFRCSGVHRGIGLHITRVKSTKLDSWTLKQMYIMSHVNNQEANTYWEANLPYCQSKPNQDTPQEALKSFILAKYVQKEFVDRGKVPPIEHILAKIASESQPETFEDEETFINRKTVQLEGILKAKSMISTNAVIQPFDYTTKNNRNVPTNSTFSDTLKIHAVDSPDSIGLVKPSGFKERFVRDRQATKGNTVNSGTVTKKRAEFAELGSLGIFAGLHVKHGVSATPKAAKIQSGDLLTPFELRTSHTKQNSLTLNSNAHEPVELQDRSSPEKQRKHEYNKSAPGSNYPLAGNAGKVFELKNFPKKKGFELDVSDLSSLSSRGDHTEMTMNVGQNKFFNNMKPLNLLNVENPKEEDKSKGQTSPYVGFGARKEDIKAQSKIIASKRTSKINLEEPKFFNTSNTNTPKNGWMMRTQGDDELRLDISGLKASRANTLTRRSKGKIRWLVLIGCLILHLGFGYVFSWGSISPYLAFFFKKDYEQAYYLDVASYSSLIFMGLTLGYTYTENLINSFGYRKASFLCFFAIFTTLSLCSWTTASTMYSSAPTLVTGFFLGLNYNIPYYCCMQYFPSSANYLKSAFYIFDAIGSFYFGYSSHLFLGLDTYTQDTSAGAAKDYFPVTVEADIPDLIQSIAYKILIIGTIGSLAIIPKTDFVERDWSALKDKEEYLLKGRKSVALINNNAQKSLYRDLKHAILSPSSKSIFQIIVFSSVLGSYYLYCYKIVGLELGYSDQFLTLLGGLGMLAMGVGKIVAIVAYEASSFRSCMQKAFVAQTLLGILAVAVYDKLAYYFIPMMFVSGFVDSIVREEITSVYSEDIGSSMTAFMMAGFTVSSFFSFTLAKVAELVISPKMINIVLVLPLIRALIVERKYTAEIKDKTSVADSEIARMLAD